MTPLRWAADTWLIVFIGGFDHWLAFLFSAFISVKMLIEGVETGS